MRYNSHVTGQMIGYLRVRKGMSQEVLSGLAGIARSHLSMIETGAKSANVETLWRIAAALDMRLSELLALVEKQLEAGQALTSHPSAQESGSTSGDRARRSG